PLLGALSIGLFHGPRHEEEDRREQKGQGEREEEHPAVAQDRAKLHSKQERYGRRAHFKSPPPRPWPRRNGQRCPRGNEGPCSRGAPRECPRRGACPRG